MQYNSTQYEILKFFDCNQREIETFLSLSQFPHGTTIVKLARATGISRPTLYGHIEQLIQKNLAKKFSQEKSSLFAPQDPAVIEELYNEKLALHTKNARHIHSLFQKTTTHVRPRFSVHEGAQSFDAITMDILRSRPVETCWVFPIDYMRGVVPEKHFDYFHQERIKRNIRMRVLWPINSVTQLSQSPFLAPHDTQHRQVRYLPERISPMIGYGIYNNKVAAISNQDEPYSFIVESTAFAQTLQSEFDYLWERSEKQPDSSI